MRKLAVMVMSFVAAVMLGGAAVLTAVMPARAADVTGSDAVEAMFETENTAAFSTFGGKNNIVVTQNVRSLFFQRLCLYQRHIARRFG